MIYERFDYDYCACMCLNAWYKSRTRVAGAQIIFCWVFCLNSIEEIRKLEIIKLKFKNAFCLKLEIKCNYLLVIIFFFLCLGN